MPFPPTTSAEWKNSAQKQLYFQLISSVSMSNEHFITGLEGALQLLNKLQDPELARFAWFLKHLHRACLTLRRNLPAFTDYCVQECQRANPGGQDGD